MSSAEGCATFALASTAFTPSGERQVHPDKLFEAIWTRAARLFPADLFSIVIYEREGHRARYEMVIDRGIRQPPGSRELSWGLDDLVVRAGKPVLVRNFELEDGSLPLSWMGSPLVVDGEVVGLVSVQSRQQGTFEQKDLSILGVLADWAASVVEWSTPRGGRTPGGTSPFAALSRAAQMISDEAEQDGVFRVIAETVPQMVRCEECYVWARRATDGHGLQPKWRSRGAGAGPEPLASPAIDPDAVPIVAEVLAGLDWATVGAGEAGRLDGLEGLGKLEGRPAALVPLHNRGEVLGLLVVLRPPSGEDFASEDAELLGALASVAGIAIQNLRNSSRASEAVDLRGLNEVKSRLISTISHELRTPLSFIQAGSELLMQRLLDPEQLRQVASLVNQGSSRLAEVVDDIIEFADLQTGVGPPTPVPTDLPVLVREAIEEAAGAAQAHRVLLETPGALPTIAVDSVKLRSVVVKLVRNAINFSPGSSIVTVRVSVGASCLKLEVSDNGFGIQPEEADRVFEPFFRGEISQVRCIPGTGMGLSIVRQLVDIMGGEVALRSQVDEGTTVVVTIPLVDPEQLPSSAKANSSKRAPAPPIPGVGSSSGV